MNPDWVRSIRDQCAQARIPLFFKKWGGTQKKKAGRELDGRTHDDLPDIGPRADPEKKERDALAAALVFEPAPRRGPLKLAK